jgi:hypothetical protein
VSERERRAREELERVKAPLEVALLDDIALGVNRLNRRLEAQVPEGIKDEVTVAVAGQTPVPMEPVNTKPPYFRAAIFNDGPSPAYVFLNVTRPIAFRQAPLNTGDHLDIDTTEAKIQALFFACTTDAGTASVRVQLLK